MTLRWSRIRSSLIAVSFALLLVGCASLIGPRVTVVNDTDAAYRIEANGSWLGTVGPRARATLAVPPLGEDPMEVAAFAPDGSIHLAVGGTRAMWDKAIDGSNPMSSWQDFECGRILLATEPFDPAVAGPVRNPCP
jgi:hypothetical protein